MYRKKVGMWHYPKDKLSEGWTLTDVYERVAAAEQLGYDVVLKAPKKGLEVEYIEKIPSIPYRFKSEIYSHILPDNEKYVILEELRESGYEVILSIGELKENDIGSNCGQYITNYLKEKERIEGGYTYPMQKI